MLRSREGEVNSECGRRKGRGEGETNVIPIEDTAAVGSSWKKYRPHQGEKKKKAREMKLATIIAILATTFGMHCMSLQVSEN